MSEHIQLDGLLCTSDASLLGVMNQVLDSFQITTEVCRQADSALQAVTHRRLDAVIVDWDSTFDPTRIVRAVRKSSPNSNSTVVALVNQGSETHALLVGANFMIHKPTDPDHARRCMRAAYGTMLQNRRRAARVPVDLPAIVRTAELSEITARVSDLSVGGLALQCDRPLEVDREVWVRFSLPSTDYPMHVTGRVVNANGTGRAGIRFSFIPEEGLIRLQNCLAVELAKLEKVEMPAQHANHEHN
jgi:CheY-like chemotaxis protein